MLNGVACLVFFNLKILSQFGGYYSISLWATLMAQWVKNLPTMQETQETWVLSLGRENPLGKEMATHSSILA